MPACREVSGTRTSYSQRTGKPPCRVCANLHSANTADGWPLQATRPPSPPIESSSGDLRGSEPWRRRIPVKCIDGLGRLPVRFGLMTRRRRPFRLVLERFVAGALRVERTHPRRVPSNRVIVSLWRREPPARCQWYGSCLSNTHCFHSEMWCRAIYG